MLVNSAFTKAINNHSQLITMHTKTHYQSVSQLTIALFLALIAFAGAVNANTGEVAEGNQSNIAMGVAAPEIAASAWALMEAKSGWVVAGFKADQPMAPASITKLMTTYVVFDELEQGRINLADSVSISEKAWRSEGSRMFADVNTTIELEHLLKSTIVQSGNDAAIALAEHVSGSEQRFANLMNQHANQIGLQHSNFANSTGLPAPGHQMSPVDILKLSAAIITDFPTYYPWYAIKEYEHNNIRQYNRNKLLWKNMGVDGLKTGHTEEAGYCLVASAERFGERWIAVVMGTESERVREAQISKLLDFGFNGFEVTEVLQDQTGVAQAVVYGGQTDVVRLKPQNPVYVALPRGRLNDLDIRFQMAPEFEAPIQISQSMGVASLYLDGELLQDVPLVAMSEIPEGGLLKRLFDSIKRSVLNLFK